MAASQLTATKKTSFFSSSHLVNTIKNTPHYLLSTIRNTIIPLGNRPKAWNYFLQKTVEYNTQHQFLTGCLLMVAFYTYPIVLMSMYAQMKSLIIVKDLPMIYAFTVNMILVILCKESIEAGFNIFWGLFTNHMIISWSKEIDGDKNLSLIIESNEHNLDVRGHISRFCKSFIQLIKNGISRASRIALALTYLLPRTTLPTIGIFFTCSMVFYSLLNKLNATVATEKKNYNNINNQYYKLQCGLQTNQSQYLGNTNRYENHKDTINENNDEVLTIQNSMLWPYILINYLNSLVQNILSIVLPVILLTQNVHFEQGALEQAKEAFLRIFLGIDPLSKDADTLSTFSESFDQVQKLCKKRAGKHDSVDPISTKESHHSDATNISHTNSSVKENNTHSTWEYTLHACIHATKTSSLYTSILSLLHLSISLVLSNPSNHLLQSILSLSWYNTLFLKLTVTWGLCCYLESLLSKEARNTIENEISHTTNFALAATFTLALLTTISFPVLLANPSVLYPSIITLSGICTLTCIKFFKYEVKTLATKKQPSVIYTPLPTPPSNKNENLVVKTTGSVLSIEMKNLVCQWEENGVKCTIATHLYIEGLSYLHYGPSGGGKSNALQLTYQGFIYQRLLSGKSAAKQNQEMLGIYGCEESFNNVNYPPSIVITEKTETKIIPILIPQNSPTQNIETPVIPEKLRNILTHYFKTHHNKAKLSNLQEFVYSEIITTALLPDYIENSPTNLSKQADEYPELKLLEAWDTIHSYMIEFIKKFPHEKKVIQAIKQENLSLLKNTCSQSVRAVLTGGSSSGGQKGLIKAAFCYALLKLRSHSFQICLLLDEAFSETGDNRESIFRQLNQAVQFGDQNSKNKPMLHVVAHHLTQSEIQCFSHEIQYPEATVKIIACSNFTSNNPLPQNKSPDQTNPTQHLSTDKI